MSANPRPFTVTIELPRFELGVLAKDAEDAAFRAWQMIGLAGVKHYGTLEFKAEDAQAIGSQR